MLEKGSRNKGTETVAMSITMDAASHKTMQEDCDLKATRTS